MPSSLIDGCGGAAIEGDGVECSAPLLFAMLLLLLALRTGVVAAVFDAAVLGAATRGAGAGRLSADWA